LLSLTFIYQPHITLSTANLIAMDFIQYVPKAATKAAAPLRSKTLVSKRKTAHTAASRAAPKDDSAGLAALERGGDLQIFPDRAGAAKSIATTSHFADIEQYEAITNGKDRGKDSPFSSSRKVRR
jgi:hypothetical protein